MIPPGFAPCPHCAGTGSVAVSGRRDGRDELPCDECGGDGVLFGAPTDAEPAGAEWLDEPAPLPAEDVTPDEVVERVWRLDMRRYAARLSAWSGR